MKKEQVLWTEKYRPHTIIDCILPDRLKNTFQDYVNKKEIPNLLLCGGPGVGKTTVARALCEELGVDYIVINGSDESGIDTLRTKIRGYASSMSLQGGRKVIILDEADYMNANSLQPALRGAIEEFAINCSFIFTCNYKHRIIEPIHSRCAVIDFKLNKKEKQEMAAKFFSRLTEVIFPNSGIQYDHKVVIELIMKYFPDFRRTLNELQRHSTSGQLTEAVLAQLSDADISELVGFLQEKEFQKVRKWVANNSDSDPNTIFRRIYDGLDTMLKPQSVPEIILILAKYQYQMAFSIDPEITLLAFLVETMVEADFK